MRRWVYEDGAITLGEEIPDFVAFDPSTGRLPSITVGAAVAAYRENGFRGPDPAAGPPGHIRAPPCIIISSLVPYI